MIWYGSTSTVSSRVPVTVTLDNKTKEPLLTLLLPDWRTAAFLSATNILKRTGPWKQATDEEKFIVESFTSFQGKTRKKKKYRTKVALKQLFLALTELQC
jgi:hypothetical protein